MEFTVEELRIIARWAKLAAQSMDYTSENHPVREKILKAIDNG